MIAVFSIHSIFETVLKEKMGFFKNLA